MFPKVSKQKTQRADLTKQKNNFSSKSLYKPAYNPQTLEQDLKAGKMKWIIYFSVLKLKKFFSVNLLLFISQYHKIICYL